ncbi:LysM peptidoglycan-binding domain-containing protein [Bacillus sp. DTU_2020_1000418_1_SI_GHA_SEK_038]|uniref:cell division suppressor protein YneA n=1 Tax=Bacillus sp. DTU_2020_1000418_1_SI_GHA_SEK_038 TaxID=3077585 RepID=UPI0028F07A26|nr:LysM peptidoglycan-binding domain-containing protein [Bacillus sp. DTU_2020_1000418_1_SI_GHA_SEK_038]WNS77265.1 LysM peptidoglycan-binding domain-containing protein [Bacillus sp. DTU_2020_1000418_1_SI_GHA_SEK_038]
MKKLWNQYSYAIILFVLSFLTVFIVINQLGESENINYMKITVNDGDTLWQIAEDFSTNHELTAMEFINWVERNNGISGERIFPGDELVIPVLEDYSSQVHTELASSH